MKILSIETSCDETAIALVDTTITDTSIQATQINSALFSQIDIHKEFGGVFPALAKREHAKHLPLLLQKILEKNSKQTTTKDNFKDWSKIETLLEREAGMFEKFKEVVTSYETPDIDYLAVTQGPGLEPALWVGISFARALSSHWNIPLIPTNHMKGHIFSVLLNQTQLEFPALAFLMSGGHTELIEMTSLSKFKIIGKTKDDAIGESYDKVARMIGFEYPGGPKIAELAQLARDTKNINEEIVFPRPMQHSKDLDFSFSGLKTAVLYKVQSLEHVNEDTKIHIAHEFEQAITDVVLHKLQKALNQGQYKTLIVSGGVIANSFLREQITNLAQQNNIPLLLPKLSDSTDNAQMIAVAAAISTLNSTPEVNPELTAQGNLGY